ncbi:MAG: tetratricopeptide repeat protein [Brevinematales bacterium]|nr:tetratricopeptide repeat protein [Brevinematales bacterium]
MYRQKVLLFLFLFFSLGWTSGAPKLYLKAMDALASQEYANAEELLSKVIQDPQTPREYQAKAYNYLGDIALVNQSYQKAQSFYRKILESYSDTPVYSRALYNMARMYVILGDEEAGIALLSDYMNRYAVSDANEDGALYWLGRAFAAKKEYYRAMGLYRELLARFPSSAYAYHTRQSLQTIENTLSTTSRDTDTQKIQTNQAKYLKLLARLLDLQNQLLDLKKQKIDELKMLLSKENL